MKMFAGLISRWTMPFGMRGIEGVGDLDAEAEMYSIASGRAGDTVLQRRALQDTP